VFEQGPTSHRTAPEPMVAVAAASPEPAPPSAWLPDDLELLADLDVTAIPDVVAASPATVAADVVAEAPAQDSSHAVVVLRRHDFALTLVAAEVGHLDPRQQAVAAVGAIGRELVEADLAAGMQTLRTRIMALNPRLRQAGEDLIDPVTEDCAVIAAHVAAGQVGLLRIGTAAAWHWRHGRLQPIFAEGEAPPVVAETGSADDFEDLLFNRASLTAPGLGAIEQPSCGEVSCAIAAGDRLLLAAAPTLVQLPPEVLVHSLAMPSCDDARLHLATAAGLGADPAQWPLAIIEIDA
jgi:type VI secretion system protein ImpM